MARLEFRAPPSPAPFEMFSRAAAAAGLWSVRCRSACAPARRAAKAESGVALRGVRRSGPTRRGGEGGRSFRVNSSGRFRGEEAQTPPRPSGTRSGAGRGRPASARARHRGDHAAVRLTTISPENPSRREAPAGAAARREAPARVAGSPTNTSGRRRAALKPGAARAAHNNQETVSHRCRKR